MNDGTDADNVRTRVFPVGKNTLYGIDNTEISETVLKYQISDFP